MDTPRRSNEALSTPFVAKDVYLMPARDSDTNLHFGILALQLEFISRDALSAALKAWMVDQTRPLGQILVAQNALTDDLRCLVDSLVVKQLERAASGVPHVITPDSTIDLVHTTVPKPADPYATRAPSIGETTSKGARFRILRPHARGGLGVVHVAHDTELNREVALKEILDKLADNEDSRSRFVAEAEITGGLEHPSIVPVYGLGRDMTGRPYYAMRFIRGDSLQDAIRKFHGPTGPKRGSGERVIALHKLLKRFIDVCNALNYAHSRGIVHRDLKPSNIMVGDYGETLVVDWGLAKRLRGGDSAREIGPLSPPIGSQPMETLAGSTVGTPNYMSPEQAEGRTETIGPASDVYSLGASLYELLTGQTSFAGINDLGTILHRVQKGDYPSVRVIDPTIPRALEAICLRAMAVRPEDRYASAGALAEDLEHWLADEPVAAMAESTLQKFQRWTRRHRSATLSAAAALVAISVVATSAFVVVKKALADEQVALQERTKALTAQKQATEAAEHDRKRAEGRETLAVEAIKNFEQAVVGNPLLKNDAKLKPLRDTLLKQPLDFSRKLREMLQADGDTRPESIRRLAEATYSLAYTTSEIGDQTDAIRGYEEALAVFQRLVDEHTTGASDQERVAEASNNLALLQRATGRHDAALKSFNHALEIFEKLAKEQPENDALENSVASILANIGNLHRDSGKMHEAFVALERALSIGKKLVKDRPDNPTYQDNLANCFNNLGNLAVASGKADQARTFYQSALDLREQLVKNAPANDTYRRNLSTSILNLGALERDTGQTKAALASFQRAIAIVEKLAAEQPSALEFQESLAHCYSDLGLLQSETEQTADGIASFKRAIAIDERLAAGNPTVHTYRHELTKNYNNLGLLERSAGQNDAALGSYRRAVELLEALVHDHPNLIDYQSSLAGSLTNLANLQADLGKPQDALAMHRRVLEMLANLRTRNAQDPSYGMRIARAHLILARDLALLSAQGNAEKAKESGDQSMAELRLAEKEGWTIWEFVELDRAFAKLRERDDLKAFLAEKKAKKPAKP